MAKGQHLSKHQQGIVRRYYDHKDTILANRLAEIVSDLSLATSEAQCARCWKRAETALHGLKAEPGVVEKLLASRNVEELARFVAKMIG